MSSFFLLHQMEEGKGEDEGGGDGSRALATLESIQCVILVIMMNLLWHIRYHDRVLSSGVTGDSLVLIRGGTYLGQFGLLDQFHSCLVKSCRLSARILMPYAQEFLLCSKQQEEKIRCFFPDSTDESLSFPESGLFFRAQGHGVISSLSCVTWKFHSDQTSLPRMSYWSSSRARGITMDLEGFLGILVILSEMCEG